MPSPYDILGVSPRADDDAIKKAYRALAKEYHPDRNADNARMTDRFKEISSAYALLSDPAQRARYDRGEIDENGKAKGPAFADGAAANRAYRAAAEDFDFDDAEGIFSDFFRFTGRRATGSGGAQSRPKSRVKNRGLDITYEITIGFEESLIEAQRQVTLNDGRKINVTIPEGIKSGQVIRLAGQGGAGLGGGESGDALIEITVADHPYFKRDGLDILLELPISLDEAILGGDLEVPTPKGRITVRVPRNSSSGRRLRLKGKGVTRRGETGHMYVTLKLVLPIKADPDLEKAIKDWGVSYGKDLRKKAGFS